MTDELPSEIQAIADRIAGGWVETIDIGPGWFDLLARLDQQLAQVSPGYSVEQCKPKFGTLRYYAHAADDDIDTSMTFTEIIRAAEDVSATLCEECGNPARQITLRGWISTLCPEHSHQRLDAANDEEIARIVKERSAAAQSTPLANVARHFGIELDDL
jgi:hypothetical protein